MRVCLAIGVVHVAATFTTRCIAAATAVAAAFETREAAAAAGKATADATYDAPENRANDETADNDDCNKRPSFSCEGGVSSVGEGEFASNKRVDKD